MTRQEKYNRKNRELINAKAKAKAKELRSTPEGKIKADLYAKEKQARYRKRKLLKDVEQFKLRVFKLRPNIEKMTRSELITYRNDWEYKTFHSYNKYWLYEDSDFKLPLREVKMMLILLEQMIDKRNKFTGIYEIRKGEKVGDAIHIEKDYYGMPIYGYEGLYSILRNGNIYVHPRKDKDGKTVKGWGRKKIIEVKDFLDIETPF